MIQALRHAKWSNAVGAFFAATMALVLSVLAVEASGADPKQWRSALQPVSSAAAGSALGTAPFEFDPVLTGSRHALQPRSCKVDKDGHPDIATCGDAFGGFVGMRHAVAVVTACLPALVRCARHADARAPPLSILSSATL